MRAREIQALERKYYARSPAQLRMGGNRSAGNYKRPLRVADEEGDRRPMITNLLIAGLLMSVSVAIHAAGVAWALRWAGGRGAILKGFWSFTRLLIRVAGWMVLCHLLEITAWALAYFWMKAIPELPSAFYFSAVTYTTTGYGDLVLPETWRLVGGVEALTGILMCGWSAGFFFAIVTRIYQSQAAQTKPQSTP